MNRNLSSSDRLPIVIGLVALGCAFVVFIVGSFALRNETCSVGVAGAAAVVEVRGFRAGSRCRQWIEADPASYYDTPDQPTKPVICVVERHGLRFTVRDQGLFNLVGNQLCTWILQNE